MQKFASQRLTQTLRREPARRIQQVRYIRTQPSAPPKKKSSSVLGPLLAVGAATAAASGAYLIRKDRDDIERDRVAKEKEGAAKEINKQIKESLKTANERVVVEKSWEKPGVFLWGCNDGGVADPSSTSPNVKLPRRFKFFDGKVIRDLKLDQDVGAAILENGDLVQWGKAYSKDEKEPQTTITGKGLTSLSLARDRIIALGSDGTVYSVPVSKEAQQLGPKPSESSWTSLRKTDSGVSYRVFQPKLGLREKVTSITSGQEHVLLLTNKGRVFSAACASDHYPSRGQLGIPGLTWDTRPEGAYDCCHEITSLQNIKQVAAGDYHSIALDQDGHIFTFGDNSAGQLGIGQSRVPYIAEPVGVPLNTLYGKVTKAKAIAIAAGGLNSFFVAEARKLADNADSKALASVRPSIDLWSCGRGINGALGNGKWNHVQDAFTKIKSLSGLVEFDEKRNQTMPINIKWLVAGATHAAAALDNSTLSDNSEPDFGYDILLWGGNSSYQLGNGKKSNIATPMHIAPPGGLEAGDPTSDGNRFQITPPRKETVDGRKTKFEQRIECGRNVTGVYCATVR